MLSARHVQQQAAYHSFSMVQSYSHKPLPKTCFTGAENNSAVLAYRDPHQGLSLRQYRSSCSRSHDDAGPLIQHARHRGQ